MEENTYNQKIGGGAIAIAVLGAVALLFFYNMFDISRMVRHGDVLAAALISCAAFVIVFTCGLVLSGRSLPARIVAAVLLLATGIMAYMTGDIIESAQSGLHVNGTFGDAMSIGFAVMLWRASGFVMAMMAISALASSKRNAPAPHKATIVVCSVLAIIMAVAPFVYAYLDENYLEPARGERNLADWKANHPYLSSQLEERNLLEENGKKNIVEGDLWHVGMSSGEWEIDYGQWEVKYNEEHDSWRAWSSPSNDLTLYAYEENSYDMARRFPDHVEDKRVHVVVEHIDAQTLETISSIVETENLKEGNFKLENKTLQPYTVSEKQREEVSSTYDDRGFPNDASGGFSWTDSSGLQWSVYLRGEQSYASTYTMNDDHATVKHTVIVAQDPSYVQDGNKVDVIEVERVDVETLNSLSQRARELLAAH